MLELTSPAPGILILTLRRRGARMAALLFTAVSALSVFTLTVQFGGALGGGSTRFESPLNLIGLVIFYTVALGCVAAGGYMAVVLLRPARLMVDQLKQTVTLTAPAGLRWVQRDLPYYGVARVSLEQDESLRAVAIILHLRSGERIVLGAVSLYAREQAAQTIAALREALP
jgi:hypothetical protein